MKKLCRWILRLCGWRVRGALPALKCVLIGAPHTSNWDFPVALLTMGALGIRGTWVGKHTIFRWPFGRLMRKLGGIPLNREETRDFVQRVIEEFDRRSELVIVIAPEGTRSRTEHWRTGFYFIAVGAKVPIALGYLDYGRKEAGVGPALYPSGDLEADLRTMIEFYADKTGKRPDMTGSIAIRPREV